MSWIDWLIVITPLTLIIWLSFYSKRYARNVVDFLAAGRCAGRYVIRIGDMMGALSVVTIIAASEQNYATGFGITFWNSILTPVAIVMSLTGYCAFRWRETRCLSKGQFIELRYGSKNFRVITAVISTLSEMIANAIGPAIAANFFIYYLGLPHKIMIFGIGLPCYAIIVVLCLALALVIICPAGRISLLITDCFQGLLTYPVLIILIGFIILKFSWGHDISPVLWGRVPDESFINPYDVEKLRDFNIFALVVTLTSNIMNRASWIGNDTSNSGRTPHEQKMAGILGAWRNGIGTILMTMLALVAVIFMNSPNFSANSQNSKFKTDNYQIRQELSQRVADAVIVDNDKKVATFEAIKAIQPAIKDCTVNKLSQTDNNDTIYLLSVREILGDTPQASYEYQQFKTLYHQMMLPTVLSKILPIGMLGMFCLLMIMLLISTDGIRIFNAVGSIVQDMILPYIKKPLDPKSHLRLIRWTCVGVAVFFMIVALFFSQLDYINMFVMIMSALWMGGAGPIMVFGLYTRFGNLTGAYCSLIFGSGFALIGCILQRTWALSVYPFLAEHNYVKGLDKFLRACSSPFEPWIHWEMNAEKFPINSYEILFIAIMLGIIAYVIGSFLTYKPYNLDKLLHRGIYRDEQSAHEVKVEWSWKTLLNKLITITPDYTKGDKVLAWSVFFYSFVYQFGLIFLAVIIWNLFCPWPKEFWNNYFWYIIIIIPAIIGVISAIWFFVGGVIDIRRLFIDLAARKADDRDNGQVN